jgi:hypothetical protein
MERLPLFQGRQLDGGVLDGPSTGPALETSALFRLYLEDERVCRSNRLIFCQHVM